MSKWSKEDCVLNTEMYHWEVNHNHAEALGQRTLTLKQIITSEGFKTAGNANCLSQLQRVVTEKKLVKISCAPAVCIIQGRLIQAVIWVLIFPNSFLASAHLLCFDS